MATSRSIYERGPRVDAPFDSDPRTYQGGGAEYGFSAIERVIANALQQAQGQGSGGGGGLPLPGTSPTAPAIPTGTPINLEYAPGLNAPSGPVPFGAQGRSLPLSAIGPSKKSGFLDFLNGNFFGNMLGLGGDILGGIAQGREADALRELQEKYLADQKADRALRATQMDPFTQQRSRQRQAMLNALLGAYQPAAYQPGGISGGLNVPAGAFSEVQQFTTPEARAAAEAWFHNVATQAAPPYFAPDISQMGYGSGPGIPSVNPPPTNNAPGSGGRPRPPDAPVRGRARRRTLGELLSGGA